MKFDNIIIGGGLQRSRGRNHIPKGGEKDRHHICRTKCLAFTVGFV